MIEKNTMQSRIIEDRKLTPELLTRKGLMSGFEYLTPERQRVVNEIEMKLRNTVETFGFQQVDGPLLQPAEFYSVKSGDELLAQTYVFEDVNGSRLVLRPELTPTIAYMIARDEGKLIFPLKWWSNPILFRKERPQKGRKRQFNQLNVDIFDRVDSGRDRAYDDVEVIVVASSVFSAFGLTKDDVVIQLNSRSLIERLFDIGNFNGSQRLQLLSLIDRASKIMSNEFNTQLKSIIQEDTYKELIISWLEIDNLEKIRGHRLLASLEQTVEYAELLRVFDILRVYGVSDFCEFSPYIVRGLGYYTGTVFEAFDRKKEYGLKRALMGGGRYDDLTNVLGGKLNITGVGFGLGQVPLEEILASRGLEVSQVSRPHIDYFIAVQSNDLREEAIRISQELRCKGKFVVIDSSIAKIDPDRITNQLSRANKSGAEYCVMVFSEEWQGGKVIIKEMKTGKQEVVDLDTLTKNLA